MKHFEDTIEDEEDLADLYHQSGNVRDMEAQAGHNRDIPQEDALDDMELNDLMVEARKDLFKDLLRAVRGGYATPAEKNVLRQMLKDNGMVMGGITLDDEQERRPQGREKAPLPEFSHPDYLAR